MGVMMLTAITTEERSPPGKELKGTDSTHWGSTPSFLTDLSTACSACLQPWRGLCFSLIKVPTSFQCLPTSFNYEVLFETKGDVTFLDGVRLPQVISIDNVSLSLWVQSPFIYMALFLKKTYHSWLSNNSALQIQAFSLVPH